MMKNMLSKGVRKKLNIDLDDLWLDYKFEFKNLRRKTKLSKLFDNDSFYVLDEDVNYFFDLDGDLINEKVYLVLGYGGNIFRKLFSLGFSILEDYVIHSLISFDNDDELYMSGLFLSKNGEKPLSEVDGYSLVWQEVLLQDGFVAQTYL